MPYSQFTTITKVKEAFGITTVEGSKFFPEVEPVTPSNTLLDYLAESVPIAVAASTEKFRSEAIVTPILIELRRILNCSPVGSQYCVGFAKIRNPVTLAKPGFWHLNYS